jgi:hypothetical protein
VAINNRRLSDHRLINESRVAVSVHATHSREEERKEQSDSAAVVACECAITYMNAYEVHRILSTRNDDIIACLQFSAILRRVE